VRLAKYIAHCGVASRRGAELIVSGGRVTIDGERVLDPARDVDERNEVAVDGKPITPERNEYYVVNKPGWSPPRTTPGGARR
jgi:23S rRNA pseudouridine2605 synthase